MKIRQTATIAGLATGAAIAFAPLATAAPTDLIDFDAINASQISSLNSFFEFGALFSGVPDTAYTADVTTGGFDVLTPAGVAEYAPLLTDPSQADELTPFLYFLYGVNPIEAGISTGASGSYNVLNGALINFADSSNASLFALFNPGEEFTRDIFIGSDPNITAALAADDPASWFFDRGVGNLAGYFGLDLSALQGADASSAAAEAPDFSDVLSSQVASLNGIFNAAAGLAGVSDDVVPGMGDLPFDTIATNDANDIFTSLIFGLNPENIADDGVIGSYHVLNGALTQFADAYNVGLYALFTGGDLVPTESYGDFLFGAETSILDAIGGDATVFSAIGDFLTNGFNDLLGYFDPTALLGAIG
ncbi:hypothetical protein PT015_08320 [Candidatus Mycobacterium wuenschmannii]|uniref:PE-PGRS family protein n=1 Tax=Candidatus Mycobacterium wuenschmannii TaxID=3027808 RepID=A0ABY8W352_9MYCO|nr:hypothetical protein [Candidatus Mycobacterium wuenschmannii]WIM89429.1 hypothetical protein PT015_08320 [Candidatus Mycobacterium wuenschmannii]